MKRSVSIGVIILIVVTVLTGCGGSGPSGKYVDSSNRVLVFSGKDKVKFNNTDGTYKVENGKITLIFNGKVQQYSYTEVGDSIVIDDVEYKKSK